MKVSEIGEFGLIDRLASILAGQNSAAITERLAIGIGDDAAVWRTDGGAVVATTDTLVSGVHFLPDRTPWTDVGWKALAVNVSDIAAMGGRPEFAIVTLQLPQDVEVERLDELYQGLADAGDAFGVGIAGGDIVRSSVFTINVAAYGRTAVDESGEPRVLRRGAASAGDVVAVTGALGGAAGGLRALREKRDEAEAAQRLIERYVRPQPRVEAGRAAVEAGLRCGIDVSDGLLQDLGHICRASRLGAVVWRDNVPIDLALAELFEPEEALRYAVAGGDDYELVLVGGKDEIDALTRAVETPVTVTGEMVIAAEHTATLLDESGNELETPKAGWDHLRAESREQD